MMPDLGRLFEDLPALTWHNDEPFGSTSIYAQWSVFRLAAENGVKVMLDGQGADEALAGYHGFFRPHFVNLLLRLRWIDLAREIRAACRLHRYSPLWAMKLLADGLAPEPVRMALRRLGSKAHGAPEWINVEALGMHRGAPDSRLSGGTAKSVGEESRRQLFSTSLPMLLHWEDRDSMAHSIESRVPFLDYRLVEFLSGLPDELKLWGGTTKRVLREAMGGTLPEQVRLRQDKIGFATAEEVWFRDRQPELFRDKIREAIDQSRGVLAAPAAEVLDAMLQGKREFSFIPWRMISFGQWMKQFNVQLPAAAS
jgi:asparagine synthase (glutamine-hydrolysing)